MATKVEDANDKDFFGGYGEWGQHVIVKSEHTILPDLKLYSLPDEIKNRADSIYCQMIHRVRRKKIRKQLVFYCTYLELGIEVNPMQLGKQFGLKCGEIQKCGSLFCKLQTGYTPPVVDATPLNYISDFCESLGLPVDAIEEISRIYGVVIVNDEALSQGNPQTVASGLLKYYTVTNGIVMKDPTIISTVTNRSSVTIDAMYKRITIADNQ
jgi:transcription initiation factor TFIIIB Brf1 subunit/transcription initiation factor TFIIB